MPHSFLSLCVALGVGFTVAPAYAHEFELLLLAPADATAVDLDDMQAAFLIAAQERDSHPNQTSEGHLGGMDVQLTLSVPDKAVADASLAFVAAPFAGVNDAKVSALAAPGNAVIVTAQTLAVLPKEVLDGRDDLAAFADRFLAETGRTAGASAVGAYLAARAVDLAVRPFDSVDDRDKLRSALTP